LKAWIKLTLLALLSIAIMALPALWLLPAALVVLIFVAVLGASPVRLYRMLLPAVPFIIVISALQVILQGSVEAALASALRMSLLYLAGSAVTATTGEGELASAIEGAFRPLDRLTGGSIGRDISTMMVLALAFIPMVREEYLSIKMAQEARGVRYSGLSDIIKGTYAIAVPLLYSLSRRADAIALAMEARCYGIKK
jgi:energy-coupling factor transporter transmembrane protein EcfT